MNRKEWYSVSTILVKLFPQNFLHPQKHTLPVETGDSCPKPQKLVLDALRPDSQACVTFSVPSAGTQCVTHRCEHRLTCLLRCENQSRIFFAFMHQIFMFLSALFQTASFVFLCVLVSLVWKKCDVMVSDRVFLGFARAHIVIFEKKNFREKKKLGVADHSLLFEQNWRKMIGITVNTQCNGPTQNVDDKLCSGGSLIWSVTRAWAPKRGWGFQLNISKCLQKAFSAYSSNFRTKLGGGGGQGVIFCLIMIIRPVSIHALS